MRLHKRLNQLTLLSKTIHLISRRKVKHREMVARSLKRCLRFRTNTAQTQSKKVVYKTRKWRKQTIDYQILIISEFWFLKSTSTKINMLSNLRFKVVRPYVIEIVFKLAVLLQMRVLLELISNII